MTLPDKIRCWNYSSNYLNGSSSNQWYIESQQIDQDLTDIKAAGINTIKIYADETNASSHLAALDKVASFGMKAIVLRFITYGTDYSVATGSANRTAAIAKMTGMVTNLKDHAAIIGWGFGNENNINLNGVPPIDWYTLVEEATAAAKVIDNTRWYFTVDADLGTYTGIYPGDAVIPSIDVLGFNIYRGKSITDLGEDLIAATSKPVILTEFGRKRPNNNTPEQTVQARDVVNLIKEIEDLYPTIVGWVHFKFTHTRITDTGDEFWEATLPLSQGEYRARDKMLEYFYIKSYCNSYAYGLGLKHMFNDGFETGDLTAWSSSVTDSGDLSVTTGAKINGNYGMSTLIDGTGAIYVQDDTPAAETTYVCQVDIDPNSVTMANNDEFNFLRTAKLADTTVFIVALGYTTASGYYIKLTDRTDAGNFSKATSNYVITDAPHKIKVIWKASTAAGANNGYMSLYIDGVLKQTVTAIDSDTEAVDFVRLGAVQNMDAGTSGTIYFDNFTSSKYISANADTSGRNTNSQLASKKSLSRLARL